MKWKNDKVRNMVNLSVRNGNTLELLGVKGLVLSVNISSSVKVPFGSWLDWDRIFYPLKIKENCYLRQSIDYTFVFFHVL